MLFRSLNFFLKFLLNNFGKSEKGASKIPKVRGGGQRLFGKNSYLSILFYFESFPKYVAIFLNCLDPLKLNSEKKYYWTESGTTTVLHS